MRRSTAVLLVWFVFLAGVSVGSIAENGLPTVDSGDGNMTAREEARLQSVYMQCEQSRAEMRVLVDDLEEEGHINQSIARILRDGFRPVAADATSGDSE